MERNTWNPESEETVKRVRYLWAYLRAIDPESPASTLREDLTMISRLDPDITQTAMRLGDILEEKEKERAKTPVYLTHQTAFGTLEFNAHTRIAVSPLKDRLITLSPTRAAVLQCLMEKPAEVIPSASILRRVWQLPPAPTNIHYVRLYVNYLRGDIGCSEETKIIHNVRGKGYTLAHPAQIAPTVE